MVLQCDKYGEDAINNSDTDEEWGIRIKENGRLEIYANEELVTTGIVTNIFADESIEVTWKKKYPMTHMSFDGDILETNIPLREHNYFMKE